MTDTPMNWRILTGDVRERLRDLDAASVQTCVTSPPYWGLRDYGTAAWEGGDPACDHEAAKRPIGNSPSSKSTLTTNNGRGPKPGDKFSAGSQSGYGHSCPCGATRIDSQIGLEPTPDAYVQQLVDVFREVRRVLKDDGTVWLNLGDSYASSTGIQTFHPQQSRNGQQGVVGPRDKHPSASRANLSAFKDFGQCKPKDLVGIPWRVAFALQADGWYLRSDIIWSKPNPMPESVTDRPTKAHEYIFLLSKRASYYYDEVAIQEPVEAKWEQSHYRYYREIGTATATTNPDRLDLGRAGTRFAGGEGRYGATRNKRSVWHVATQPYPEAHFATFPEALIEPCVLAGSRIGDTVLDPFCGSGTTGAVAIRHQRNFVGVELSPAYVQLARARIGGEAPLFATEHTA